MDLKKLCEVVVEETNSKKITDSVKKKDTKKYRVFKVTDAYKDLRKKIKDDLMETEDTLDAIDVVTEYIEDAPAEQVVAATIEVLAEAIDTLEDKIAAGEAGDIVEDAPEEKVEEEVETEVKEEVTEE